MTISKKSTILVLSSWNLVRMINYWGNFHQISWGLDEKCGLFTNGQFLNVGPFFDPVFTCNDVHVMHVSAIICKFVQLHASSCNDVQIMCVRAITCSSCNGVQSYVQWRADHACNLCSLCIYVQLHAVRAMQARASVFKLGLETWSRINHIFNP